MTVIPLAPTKTINMIPTGILCDKYGKQIGLVNRNTGIGEALAFKTIRLCISTQWSDETKRKANLTTAKLRAEFARIIYQVQWLKKVSLNGNIYASLELVSLLSTLDMFEEGMLNKEMLGVDKR